MLITAKGGIKAIAISHPHFYATMIDWSRALGGVPITCTKTIATG